MANSPSQTRNNCIDLLRFVFSMIVVLHHWIDVTMVQLPHWLMELQTRLTTFAILGFFILSGYLITQSYDHEPALGRYLLKRAKRLLPPYLLMLIACAFGLSMVSQLPPSEYFFSRDWWLYLAANITFLNFLHPTLPGVFDSPLINDATVNPALWTLKIEVAFYLVLPLLWLLIRRARRPWLTMGLLYLLSIAYQIVLFRLGEVRHSSALLTLSHQLPGMLCYFLGGMFVYTYRERFFAIKHYLIAPALIEYIVEEAVGVTIFSPLMLGAVVMWAAYSLPRLNHVVRWGDVSYGMYVYHAPMLKLLATAGIFAAWPTVAAVALYVGIVFGISYLSWHLMEKPIISTRIERK